MRISYGINVLENIFRLVRHRDKSLGTYGYKMMHADALQEYADGAPQHHGVAPLQINGPQFVPFALFTRTVRGVEIAQLLRRSHARAVMLYEPFGTVVVSHA